MSDFFEEEILAEIERQQEEEDKELREQLELQSQQQEELTGKNYTPEPYKGKDWTPPSLERPKDTGELPYTDADEVPEFEPPTTEGPDASTILDERFRDFKDPMVLLEEEIKRQQRRRQYAEDVASETWTGKPDDWLVLTQQIPVEEIPDRWIKRHAEQGRIGAQIELRRREWLKDVFNKITNVKPEKLKADRVKIKTLLEKLADNGISVPPLTDEALDRFNALNAAGAFDPPPILPEQKYPRGAVKPATNLLATFVVAATKTAKGMAKTLDIILNEVARRYRYGDLLGQEFSTGPVGSFRKEAAEFISPNEAITFAKLKTWLGEDPSDDLERLRERGMKMVFSGGLASLTGLSKFIEAHKTAGAEYYKDGFMKILANTAEALPYTLTAMLAATGGLLLGGPTVAAALGFGTSFLGEGGETYDRVIANGGTHEDAIKGLLVGGAVKSALEVAGIWTLGAGSFWLPKLFSRSLPQMLAGILGEGSTESLQAMVDLILERVLAHHPSPNIRALLRNKETRDAAITAAMLSIVTGVGGKVVGTGFGITTKVAQEVVNRLDGVESFKRLLADESGFFLMPHDALRIVTNRRNLSITFNTKKQAEEHLPWATENLGYKAEKIEVKGNTISITYPDKKHVPDALSGQRKVFVEKILPHLRNLLPKVVDKRLQEIAEGVLNKGDPNTEEGAFKIFEALVHKKFGKNVKCDLLIRKRPKLSLKGEIMSRGWGKNLTDAQVQYFIKHGTTKEKESARIERDLRKQGKTGDVVLILNPRKYWEKLWWDLPQNELPVGVVETVIHEVAHLTKEGSDVVASAAHKDFGFALNYYNLVRENFPPYHEGEVPLSEVLPIAGPGSKKTIELLKKVKPTPRDPKTYFDIAKDEALEQLNPPPTDTIQYKEWVENFQKPYIYKRLGELGINENDINPLWYDYKEAIPKPEPPKLGETKEATVISKGDDLLKGLILRGKVTEEIAQENYGAWQLGFQSKDEMKQILKTGGGRSLITRLVRDMLMEYPNTPKGKAQKEANESKTKQKLSKLSREARQRALATAKRLAAIARRDGHTNKLDAEHLGPALNEPLKQQEIDRAWEQKQYYDELNSLSGNFPVSKGNRADIAKAILEKLSEEDKAGPKRVGTREKTFSRSPLISRLMEQLSDLVAFVSGNLDAKVVQTLFNGMHKLTKYDLGKIAKGSEQIKLVLDGQATPDTLSEVGRKFVENCRLQDKIVAPYVRVVQAYTWAKVARRLSPQIEKAIHDMADNPKDSKAYKNAERRLKKYQKTLKKVAPRNATLEDLDKILHLLDDGDYPGLLEFCEASNFGTRVNYITHKVNDPMSVQLSNVDLAKDLFKAINVAPPTGFLWEALPRETESPIAEGNPVDIILWHAHRTIQLATVQPLVDRIWFEAKRLGLDTKTMKALREFLRTALMSHPPTPELLKLAMKGTGAFWWQYTSSIVSPMRFAGRNLFQNVLLLAHISGPALTKAEAFFLRHPKRVMHAIFSRKEYIKQSSAFRNNVLLQRASQTHANKLIGMATDWSAFFSNFMTLSDSFNRFIGSGPPLMAAAMAYTEGIRSGKVAYSQHKWNTIKSRLMIDTLQDWQISELKYLLATGKIDDFCFKYTHWKLRTIHYPYRRFDRPSIMQRPGHKAIGGLEVWPVGLWEQLYHNSFLTFYKGLKVGDFGKAYRGARTAIGVWATLQMLAAPGWAMLSGGRRRRDYDVVTILTDLPVTAPGIPWARDTYKEFADDLRYAASVYKSSRSAPDKVDAFVKAFDKPLKIALPPLKFLEACYEALNDKQGFKATRALADAICKRIWPNKSRSYRTRMYERTIVETLQRVLFGGAKTKKGETFPGPKIKLPF